jgi:SAM-dependent methyltransferase
VVPETPDPDHPATHRALDQLTALRTPDGGQALAAATELAGDDPLAAATALRARGMPPDLAAAALTQARLRARAAGKFGADAARMYFTATGLEQATRPGVAERRAARLAAAGVNTLTDLGCGIGADTIAAARAGIRVRAVDADPATAAVAAANLAVLGLADRTTVECARAEEVDLAGTDAVFCDPARRTGTGRRVFDPAAFSPPWSFVASLPGRVPRTVLKLAPGIDHALLPEDAEAEWVSVDGDLVEATCWCGPLAAVPRRASLLRARWPEAVELVGSGQRKAPTGPVRRFLHDPDPAVLRAHLAAELADVLAANLADPTIGYLYTDEPARTAYARSLEVHQVLPFSRKRLRAALRAAGVGRVEIMKRGSALEPDRLRRDLRLSGDAAATVVLTRVAGAPTAFICTPL